MPKLNHESSLLEVYSSIYNRLHTSWNELNSWLQLLDEIAQMQRYGLLGQQMQQRISLVRSQLQQAAMELRGARELLEAGAETQPQRQQLEEQAQRLQRQREALQQQQQELVRREESLYARQQQLDAMQADLEQCAQRPDEEALQQARRQLEELEQQLQAGQAQLEQMQQQTGEIARQQEDVEQKAKMLCLREEQLTAWEASLEQEMAVRRDRSAALASMQEIQSAMMEMQRLIRQVGPAFGNLTERVNGGFVAGGVRNLIRCSRSLRQLGTDEARYYAEELERILAGDFGCEKIWPAAGDAIDPLTMAKLDASAPGNAVQAVVYGGWRMEETILEKAVVLPIKG